MVWTGKAWKRQGFLLPVAQQFSEGAGTGPVFSILQQCLALGLACSDFLGRNTSPVEIVQWEKINFSLGFVCVLFLRVLRHNALRVNPLHQIYSFTESVITVFFSRSLNAPS